jgi:hypothetical protein
VATQEQTGPLVGVGTVVVFIPGMWRARVYVEGGFGFDIFVSGPGWVVCDDPDPGIIRLALAARAVAFPQLPALTLADVVG